jgi:hypothetical protein
MTWYPYLWFHMPSSTMQKWTGLVQWKSLKIGQIYSTNSSLINITRRFQSRYRRTHSLCGLLPGPEATNQNRCLPARFKWQRRAARQLLFVEGHVRALTRMVTSNLASNNNTLSLSTLLCRRRHHASEVHSYSRHDLSAMCPGVKSVARQNDAISPGRTGC